VIEYMSYKMPHVISPLQRRLLVSDNISSKIRIENYQC